MQPHKTQPSVEDNDLELDVQPKNLAPAVEQLQSDVAQLQSALLASQDPDGGTETDESGFDLDIAPDGSQLHPWRVITQDHPSDATKRQWACVNNDGSAIGTGAIAGSVISPKGTAATDVTAAWVDYVIADGVTGWLKATVDLATDTVTYAVIETTLPTADPFNTATAIFVYKLFAITAATGVIAEYQFSDVDLQAMFTGITQSSITVSGVPTLSHPIGPPVLTFPNWTMQFKYGRLILCTANAGVAITVC